MTEPRPEDRIKISLCERRHRYIAEKPASELADVKYRREEAIRNQSDKKKEKEEEEVEKLDEIYGTGAYVNDKGHTYQNYKPLEVPDFE